MVPGTADSSFLSIQNSPQHLLPRAHQDVKISMHGVYLRVIYRKLTSAYDTAIAELVRNNLKAYRLDIPGTVYYDENLYHLSDYYDAIPDKRFYYVLMEGDTVLGGIGLAEFSGIDDCAELQKLYLDDSVKGRGLSYDMMNRIEAIAREFGYRRIYLETHDNLKAAIHLYEKCGYREIERPETVVHSTMNRFFLKEL